MSNETRSILVTGASTGIGRAIAERLAANGFTVFAGARKEQDLEQLARIPNVEPIKLDVTSDGDVNAAVKVIERAGTGLFAVVNNAGIALAGPLADIDVADFEQQFAVNVVGVHRVTKAVLPSIIKSKGRVIMISSNSGFFAMPFFGPYCASKFATEGYSDALRRELALVDVKVVIIQPGRISTPIWDKGKGLLEKYRGREQESPFGTVGLKVGEYAIQKGNTAGLSPTKIAEAVHHALTSDKPRIRYLIAPDMFRNRMLKILPASKIDAMIHEELKKLK
nr:SDR family oxidoreductase [Candidatus Sigynarchaeota archaeon]